MSGTPSASHVKGRDYESMACDYLQQQGLRLIERNYRSRQGEIDLIMMDGDYLVFVEVRYRSSPRFGNGAETIDQRKQFRLIATAARYLQERRRSTSQAARFDVISIGPQQNTSTIHWIKDAIQAE